MVSRTTGRGLLPFKERASAMSAGQVLRDVRGKEPGDQLVLKRPGIGNPEAGVFLFGFQYCLKIQYIQKFIIPVSHGCK